MAIAKMGRGALKEAEVSGMGVELFAMRREFIMGEADGISIVCGGYCLVVVFVAVWRKSIFICYTCRWNSPSVNGKRCFRFFITVKDG